MKDCNITEWNKNAKTLCFPGLLSKFEQNPGLAAFLKNTRNKTLVECCWDDVWGNGKPLSDPECIDGTKFDHQGILGEMLEEICSILQSRPMIAEISHQQSDIGLAATCGNSTLTDAKMHDNEHE